MSIEEPSDNSNPVISNFLNNFIGEEVSAQTRMKLSRIAKRTAPRRKIVRAMRAKKRKSLLQLKKRAKNRIKDVLRHKVSSGSWKKMSMAQRVQIDRNINKRKKIVDKMIQRVMPEVIRGESERLRNLNSSFEPDYINFILEAEQNRREPDSNQKKIRKEQNKVNKRAQRERDDMKKQAGDTAGSIMVIRSRSGDVEIIDKESYNSSYHEIIVPSDKATVENVKEYLQDPAFVNTSTSVKLFGMVQGSGKSKKNPPSKNQEEGSEPVEEAPPPMIPATKKASKNDTFATTHGAEEMENGISFTINSMLGLSPEQMISMGLMSEREVQMSMENRNQSFIPSCQRASQLLMSQVGGLLAKQTGRSKKESKLSETAKQNGVKDKTPKTDILFLDQQTKQPVIRASVKVGSSQFTSGGQAETTSFLQWSMLQVGDQLQETEKTEIKNFIDFFKTNLSGNLRTQSGPVSLFQTGGTRYGEISDVVSREELHTKATEMLNNILNNNKKFAATFIYAILTGSGKFEDESPSIATHILSLNHDGTDTKLTPITIEYAEKLVGSVKFQLRFKSTPVTTKTEKLRWREFKAHKELLGEKVTYEEDWRPYTYRSVMGAINTVTEKRVVFNFMKRLFEQNNKESDVATIPDPETPEQAIKYLQDAFEYIGNDYFKLYQFFEDSFDFNTSEPIIDWTQYAQNPGTRTNKIYVNGKEFQIPVENPYNYSEDGSMRSPLGEERDYKKEYKNYHSKPEQRANRSKRVLARRLMMKLGKVKKGDGKDVDHKDGNPQNNGKHNLRVRNKSENRADNGH
jgi:hypothetical protein